MTDTKVIGTTGLSKRYKLGLTRKSIDAVIDLNIEVFTGEVFAFIGLNGAGKTTTIKLLLDHAKPTKGKAYLFGIDATQPGARRRIGYLPDMPHFYNFLTANELLDYAGKLFSISKQERKQRISRLLDLVGLAGRGDERLKGFSRGMLQRLGLAQALINDPKLVILDEPLGGLDPIGRVELREIIANLKTEGKTVFFSSHILDDAQRIADRVGIIHHGRMVACGRLEELLTGQSGWDVELVINDGFDLSALSENQDWQVLRTEEYHKLIVPDEQALQKLYHMAAEGNIQLLSLNRKRLNLEEAFLKELDRWSN